MGKQVDSIGQLTTDPANANLGTERGQFQIEESVDRCGYGRSIVVDRSGVTIAGNHVLEDAVARGLSDDDVVFVRSRGNQLIVHVREDLELASDARARELGVRDNRTAQVNLKWDALRLDEFEKMGVELASSFKPAELAAFRARIEQDFIGEGIADLPAPVAASASNGDSADVYQGLPRVPVRVRIYVEDGMLCIRPVYFYQEWLTDVLQALEAVPDGESVFNATI